MAATAGSGGDGPLLLLLLLSCKGSECLASHWHGCDFHWHYKCTFSTTWTPGHSLLGPSSAFFQQSRNKQPLSDILCSLMTHWNPRCVTMKVPAVFFFPRGHSRYFSHKSPSSSKSMFPHQLQNKKKHLWNGWQDDLWPKTPLITIFLASLL